MVKESVDNITVCSTEFDDQLWAVMRWAGIFYSHDNSRCIFIILLHKISTNGRCEPYYVRNSGNSICDGVYDPNDYVYIPERRLGGSQYLLRLFGELVNGVISSIPERCKVIANRLLCTHYYLPCGNNGTIHVPLPICPWRLPVHVRNIVFWNVDVYCWFSCLQSNW